MTADARRITIPEPSIVLLVGPAGCGKSTFAERHFGPADVLSSDTFRGLVSGDPADQRATGAAFRLLRHTLDERMERRRFTVVDATNVTRRERSRFLGVARRHGLPAVAVVFDLPLSVCQQLAASRADRDVPAEVVAKQHATFRRHLDHIGDELFEQVAVLSSIEEMDRVEVERRPLTDRAAPVSVGTERPPAVIVDLDGTLTSAAWRVPLISGRRRDWPSFFAGMGRDAPVDPLVDLVGWIADHVTVVLLTGRPVDHEPAVLQWLEEHDVVYDRLLMRDSGDRRPDTVVKRERYRREIAPGLDVRFVIDDRPQVIEMWREEGLYVLTAVDPELEPLEDPAVS